MTSNQKTLSAIALSAILPIAAQAATVVWDNSSSDGLWTTATNWDGNTLPGSGDIINISNGDTVTSLTNNQPGGSTINLTGNSTLTRPNNVIRMNGITING